MNDHHPTRGNRRREQDPAYGLLQPKYSHYGYAVTISASTAQGSDCASALWYRGVAMLTEEFSQLSGARRSELVALLAEAGGLKEEIVLLSDAADGSAICAVCNGACCRVGKYHVAPLDLLAFSAAGKPPVAPDFATGACPFLGVAGCRIVPSDRPFICVVFCCELIEQRLSAADISRLVRMEAELRCLREEMAARFGRRLVESMLLEMERTDRDGVPFLTINGG